MNKAWSFPRKLLQSNGGNRAVNFKNIVIKKFYGAIVEKALHLSLKGQQIFLRRQSEKGQEIV